MAHDYQLPWQDKAAQTSFMKGDIPALVKAVAEKLGPWIDKVVPGKCCIKVGIYVWPPCSALSTSQVKSRQRISSS